jgi:hypothetical protein
MQVLTACIATMIQCNSSVDVPRLRVEHATTLHFLFSHPPFHPLSPHSNTSHLTTQDQRYVRHSLHPADRRLNSVGIPPWSCPLVHNSPRPPPPHPMPHPPHPLPKLLLLSFSYPSRLSRRHNHHSSNRPPHLTSTIPNLTHPLRHPHRQHNIHRYPSTRQLPRPTPLVQLRSYNPPSPSAGSNLRRPHH